MNVRKLAASGAICFYLGMQGFASFNPGLPHEGGYFWPFAAYLMYGGRHHEGEAVNRYQIYGILEDGSEVRIASKDLGFNDFSFYRGPVTALLQQKQNKITHFAELYASKHGRKLKAFRLENRALLVTRSGPQETPRFSRIYPVGAA